MKLASALISALHWKSACWVTRRTWKPNLSVSGPLEQWRFFCPSLIKFWELWIRRVFLFFSSVMESHETLLKLKKDMSAFLCRLQCTVYRRNGYGYGFEIDIMRTPLWYQYFSNFEAAFRPLESFPVPRTESHIFLVFEGTIFEEIHY